MRAYQPIPVDVPSKRVLLLNEPGSLRPTPSPIRAYRPIPMPRGLVGLGDALQQAQQAVAVGGSLAAATEGAGVALIPGLTAGAAIPIIGAGVAVVTLAIALIEQSGCGQTCIISSDDANKVEPYLQQNLKGYLAGPRTMSSQTKALQNFDYFWNYLVQACSNPQLGNAGRRCISDRQAGSCKWRDASGQCWNWFIGYRDPIANDPNVQPDPVVDTSPVASTTTTTPTPGVTDTTDTTAQPMASGGTMIPWGAPAESGPSVDTGTSPWLWGALVLAGVAVLMGATE